MSALPARQARCGDCGRTAAGGVHVEWSEQHERALCLGCYDRAGRSTTVEQFSLCSPIGAKGSRPSTANAAESSTSPSLQAVSSSLQPDAWGTVSTHSRGFEGQCDEGPEVEELLARHRAGAFDPVDVVFAVEPLKPSPAMRAVLADFALIYGLRLAAEDDRPVAFGAEWAAARIGLPVRTVRRVLRRLVELGVLEVCGELPARCNGDGRRNANGTRTYLPAGGPRNRATASDALAGGES